jgi:hypothetical protein
LCGDTIKNNLRTNGVSEYRVGSGVHVLILRGHFSKTYKISPEKISTERYSAKVINYIAKIEKCPRII